MIFEYPRQSFVLGAVAMTLFIALHGLHPSSPLRIFLLRVILAFFFRLVPFLFLFIFDLFLHSWVALLRRLRTDVIEPSPCYPDSRIEFAFSESDWRILWVHRFRARCLSDWQMQLWRRIYGSNDFIGINLHSMFVSNIIASLFQSSLIVCRFLTKIFQLFSFSPSVSWLFSIRPLYHSRSFSPFSI